MLGDPTSRLMSFYNSKVRLNIHKALSGTVSLTQYELETNLPRQGRPLQTWKTFLRNHAEGIASIDLFVVPTVASEQLFGSLVLGHGRRRLTIRRPSGWRGKSPRRFRGTRRPRRGWPMAGL
jgi:hypothetical protein